MSKEYLSTYLNDHLAGSVTAIEILDHFAEEASDIAPFLKQLRRDIEEDRDQLVVLMDRLDILPGRIRKASGWLVHQVVEAKFEADDQPDGLLRRLERLEAIGLGINGKLGLWRALHTLAESEERLSGPDYEQLAQRAKEQLERVEALRLEAARSALTLAA